MNKSLLRADPFCVVCFCIGYKEKLCSGKLIQESSNHNTIYVQSLEDIRICTEINMKNTVFIQLFWDMTEEEFKEKLTKELNKEEDDRKIFLDNLRKKYGVSKQSEPSLLTEEKDVI